MPYIKSGIVTRIEIKKGRQRSIKFIEKNFNINFFDIDKDNGKYLLKEDIFNENIKSYRKEYLSFTRDREKSDSLDSCEAYCLEKNINNILDNKIYFIDGNRRYLFEGDDSFIFSADKCFYEEGGMKLVIYFVAVFWDISIFKSADFSNITITVNNLTRKAMKNVLKDVSWFTII